MRVQYLNVRARFDESVYSFSESYKPGGITVTGLYYSEENPNPKDVETGKSALPTCGAYSYIFLRAHSSKFLSLLTLAAHLFVYKYILVYILYSVHYSIASLSTSSDTYSYLCLVFIMRQASTSLAAHRPAGALRTLPPGVETTSS